MTRILGRRLAGPLAAVLCCAVGLAVGSPGAGSAAAGRPGGAAAPDGLAGSAGSAGLVSQPVAGPGTNLLLNPGAQAGAASAEGWDAVTIPGWQVSSGLPTVVPYGAPHLSPATGQGPAVHGGSLFAGGAGGTARLTQAVSLRQAAGPPVATGTRYQLSGWLGGTARSQAAVTVAFLSATGTVLARRVISHGRGNDRLAYRAAAGTLPAGTASARVTLALATSLTNDDGPNAPLVGYDRAVADGLRFSVSAPVRRPAPLTPPAAHVPRYQHVFLFYFENEDLGAVLANTKQAPFLNSLVPHSSVLATFFAEEHPSDANYLALAGGSAFGVPLTDPLELNPQYTIHARNIGDLISARHETWKTYPQSANGPCDDTVHKYYWNDDEPMTYFADVRGRPAYCAAHLLPLPALRTDLARAATTPSFVWPAPDDCADMEGCGIKAGDRFLQTELGAIMRSPAWRTQRSLAIITFDEDGYDYEHPAQRVLTLMLGSGVRQGYVSHVRYTHYSLLRTIEAALGLGTLTRNDRYAQPVNDVFSPGSAAPAPAASAAAAPAPGAGQAPPAGGTPMATGTRAAPARALTAPRHPTAFVVNSGGTVTPINTSTRRAGKPIPVGKQPRAIAITPNGKTAYVLDWGSAAVTPISTATNRAGPAIRVGSYPFAIAIAMDGKTAYVANYGSNTVTPISTATGRPGPAVPAGQAPDSLAVTPASTKVFVVGGDSDTVTAITAATGRAGRGIPVGYSPAAVAISPSGGTAYVVNTISGTLTPVNTATGVAGRPIRTGIYTYPTAIGLTPSSATAVVVGTYAGRATLVSTSTRKVIARVTVGLYPVAVAIAG
jgi:YVTN family beta-propeller protein